MWLWICPHFALKRRSSYWLCGNQMVSVSWVAPRGGLWTWGRHVGYWLHYGRTNRRATTFSRGKWNWLDVCNLENFRAVDGRAAGNFLKESKICRLEVSGYFKAGNIGKTLFRKNDPESTFFYERIVVDGCNTENVSLRSIAASVFWRVISRKQQFHLI